MKECNSIFPSKIMVLHYASLVVKLRRPTKKAPAASACSLATTARFGIDASLCFLKVNLQSNFTVLHFR